MDLLSDLLKILLYVYIILTIQDIILQVYINTLLDTLSSCEFYAENCVKSKIDLKLKFEKDIENINKSLDDNTIKLYVYTSSCVIGVLIVIYFLCSNE